jgi:hypothetical protein
MLRCNVFFFLFSTTQSSKIIYIDTTILLNNGVYFSYITFMITYNDPTSVLFFSLHWRTLANLNIITKKRTAYSQYASMQCLFFLSFFSKIGIFTSGSQHWTICVADTGLLCFSAKDYMCSLPKVAKLFISIPMGSIFLYITFMITYNDPTSDNFIKNNCYFNVNLHKYIDLHELERLYGLPWTN